MRSSFETQEPTKFRPLSDHLGDRLPTGGKRSMPDQGQLAAKGFPVFVMDSNPDDL